VPERKCTMRAYVDQAHLRSARAVSCYASRGRPRPAVGAAWRAMFRRVRSAPVPETYRRIVVRSGSILARCAGCNRLRGNRPEVLLRTLVRRRRQPVPYKSGRGKAALALVRPSTAQSGGGDGKPNNSNSGVMCSPGIRATRPTGQRASSRSHAEADNPA
jgi:hypothetical protein